MIEKIMGKLLDVKDLDEYQKGIVYAKMAKSYIVVMLLMMLISAIYVGYSVITNRYDIVMCAISLIGPFMLLYPLTARTITSITLAKVDSIDEFSRKLKAYKRLRLLYTCMSIPIGMILFFNDYGKLIYFIPFMSILGFTYSGFMMKQLKQNLDSIEE